MALPLLWDRRGFVFLILNCKEVKMRIEKQMLNDALRTLGKAVYQTSPVELYRSVRFVGEPGCVRVG